MSDTDPEVVRLIRDLLIRTDKLGAGHQTRAQDIARRLDLAGKVILDKGSVPEWMEPCADVGDGANYTFDFKLPYPFTAYRRKAES
ncbi:MAG TPA: hypothetical protein VN520_24740 [Streptomyces sp.]|jgi:hypothetical protein|uniref:hypothetical protein n=1 Tax=Streptomyces sp. TaxID=1931 RepID=UPI002B943F07|nr:hypothetical protein [Streptomyces sp.]HWU09545.1 hypothetical protein [Streptomyces sp.]